MIVEEVIDIHHIHIWTVEGNYNYLTAHIYISKNLKNEKVEEIKHNIKHKFKHLNINHAILEFETSSCHEIRCEPNIDFDEHQLHHHH